MPEQTQPRAGQSQGAAQAEAAGRTVFNTRPKAQAVGGIGLGTAAPTADGGPSAPPPLYETDVERLKAQMQEGVVYLISAVPLIPTQRPDQEDVTVGTNHGTHVTSVPITAEGVTVRALCTTNWKIKVAHIMAAKQGISIKEYYKRNPKAKRAE